VGLGEGGEREDLVTGLGEQLRRGVEPAGQLLDEAGVLGPRRLGVGL
jgi:hypothetical protein